MSPSDLPSSSPDAQRPSATLPPETVALLACAQYLLRTRSVPSFAAALQACVSPAALSRAAAQHGMLGLLADTVARAEIDQPALVAAHLASLQKSAARRSLRQAGSLVRLLDELEARGVHALPIKGPVWGESLYGDVTMRQWDDLDVLVAFDQIEEARRAFLDLGFVDAGAHSGRVVRRAARAEGQIPLVHETDKKLRIDLHWEVSVGPGGEGLTGVQLLGRACSASLLGRRIVAPSPSDALLIMCLQGTRDRWNSVQDLLATAIQASRLEPESWPGILASARAAGLARRVAVGVAHVSRVMALEPPAEIEELLQRDVVARMLLATLGPDTLIRPSVVGREWKLAGLRWRIASSDSLPSALRHLLARAFRPNRDDWEHVSLPPGLEFAYWVVRPVRLLRWWTLGHTR